MRLSGNKITTEFTPLQVTGAIVLTGGAAVQFYDGTSYTPDRSGSPIVIRHNISVINPDQAVTGAITITPTTTFYENGAVISSATAGYTLVGTDSLRVNKNIPSGASVEIKAKSEFVDSRTGKTYEREDTITLRTLLKATAQYSLELDKKGKVAFDAYRNPNTTTTVTATLKQGATEVTDLTGIALKWLNADGQDAVENELYADTVTPNGKTITIDKTYIDHEKITCEAWRGQELLATESVTFIRKFNSFRTDVRIPELPLKVGINKLTCSLLITDMIGNVNVDEAFLVTWMVTEGSTSRAVGTGANVVIPVSAINMKAANLSIFPDIKRREAFAALTDMQGSEEVLLTDDNDNVLTAETYGI